MTPHHKHHLEAHKLNQSASLLQLSLQLIDRLKYTVYKYLLTLCLMHIIPQLGKYNISELVFAFCFLLVIEQNNLSQSFFFNSPIVAFNSLTACTVNKKLRLLDSVAASIKREGVDVLLTPCSRILAPLRTDFHQNLTVTHLVKNSVSWNLKVHWHVQN